MKLPWCILHLGEAVKAFYLSILLMLMHCSFKESNSSLLFIGSHLWRVRLRLNGLSKLDSFNLLRWQLYQLSRLEPTVPTLDSITSKLPNILIPHLWPAVRVSKSFTTFKHFHIGMLWCFTNRTSPSQLFEFFFFLTFFLQLFINIPNFTNGYRAANLRCKTHWVQMWFNGLLSG